MNTVKLGVLCYLKRDGQTLMLYRNKKPNDIHEGKWNGLGGKIEPGESPEDAVCREVMEESHLALHKPLLKGIITFPHFKDNFDWYVYLYLGWDFSGEMLPSDEGELHWIDDEKIQDLNLWEGDLLFFDWMKSDRFFSAKIIYEDERLADHKVFFY